MPLRAKLENLDKIGVMYNPHTYIVQCEQYFKIGYTTGDIEKRIKGMDTGNPFPITPIFQIDWNGNKTAAKCCENHLHNKFAAKKMKGEWFLLTKNDLQDIQRQYKGRAKTLNEPHPHAVDSSWNKEFEFYKRRYVKWKIKYKDYIRSSQRWSSIRDKSMRAHIDKLCQENEYLEKQLKVIRTHNRLNYSHHLCGAIIDALHKMTERRLINILIQHTTQ